MQLYTLEIVYTVSKFNLSEDKKNHSVVKALLKYSEGQNLTLCYGKEALNS